MTTKIGLTEAGNFVFENSNDDDNASSESLFSPERENCRQTSNIESYNTLLKVEQTDSVARAQQSTKNTPHNNSQSKAARNSFIGYQATASFTPKFGTHDYIPSKPTLVMPYTLQEIDSFKVFFQKSLCMFVV